MAPKELPGFYFDPEKNRYFPIKGPIPGRALKKASMPDPPQPHPGKQRQGRAKRTGASEILLSRELDGRILNFNRKRCNFQQICHAIQASNPTIWMYESTNDIADSALKPFNIAMQTAKGCKVASVLATGSMTGAFSLLDFGQAGRLDYGFSRLPLPVWPSTPECKFFPASLWSTEEMSTRVTCSISSINRISDCCSGSDDTHSSQQNALISTLGCGGSGGSLYFINLRDPFDVGSTNSFFRRFSKVASMDCTLWTSVCNPAGTHAAVGTDEGAAMIHLDTQRVTWLYRCKSDVFSQQYDNSGNVILCGLRNGSIVSIDTRQKQHTEISGPRSFVGQAARKKHRGKSGASSLFCMPSAVCSLVSLTSDDQYLLASSMDGCIKLFDRRLYQKGSVQSYEGNQNSHSRLELAVNPSETLFLTGGEDCCMRIWNIKTAELLFAERVNFIPITACWGQHGLMELENCFNDELNSRCHSWSAWSGSREGLFYLHGT